MTKKRPVFKRASARRVPRPIIAMAAPAADRPQVTIDRLKGGELVWSLRVPGATLPRAIQRAVAQAQALQAQLDDWQAALAAKKADMTSKLTEASIEELMRRKTEGGR